MNCILGKEEKREAKEVLTEIRKFSKEEQNMLLIWLNGFNAGMVQKTDGQAS